MGSFLSIYLLALVGLASAQFLNEEEKPLTANVIPRGCIRIDKQAVCTSTPGGVKISHKGFLQAGFPPYNLPEYTKPLCEISYIVKPGWADVQFDVDDIDGWCLKGLNGEKVACCHQKEQVVDVQFYESPYFLKKEGSAMTDGRHETKWEDAFPKTLTMKTDPTSNSAFVYDPFSPLQQPVPISNGINTGQQPEPFMDPGTLNPAAAGSSTLNLNNIIASNPVQPAVPENWFGQLPDDGAGTAPYFAANIKVPEYPTSAQEGTFFRA
ncbi:hypothetical protein MMC22_003714 [Lobaria immixta]|nr:hypothetical protein [Lobaria immixta]